MEKAKRVIPAICGVVGLVAGCVLAYFVFAFIWTRLFVKPEDVTVHDTDIVLALSIIAGVITGLLALQVSAHRYWNPQNGNLRRNLS